MSVLPTIRAAGAEDMSAVAAIFAGYVDGTVTTFELEAPTVPAWVRRLNELRSEGWPFLVAELDGRVVGYAYAAPWRNKPAYRFTVEDSVYVAPEQTGRGAGRRLLGQLMVDAAAAGAHQMIAIIADSGDPASIALHRSAGFAQVGLLRNVGHKHGRWLDVVLMQAALAPSV